MKLNDIFNITRGVRLTKANQQPGNIPLVTAGNINDGIKGKINNGLSALYSHVITIDMFGRETPVEISFADIKVL